MSSFWGELLSHAVAQSFVYPCSTAEGNETPLALFSKSLDILLALSSIPPSLLSITYPLPLHARVLVPRAVARIYHDS